MLEADLITWVSNLRPSVRVFVRPQKVSSILMKFGIQVVLDERCKNGKDHALIQGQGQGHEPMKVENSTICEGYLFPHLQWGLANDH